MSLLRQIDMSDDSELENAPPVYSIFKDNMLVAYARRAVTASGEGAIRRASGKEPTVLAPIAYGTVDCFDVKAAQVMIEKSREAASFDALMFELKLDGFDVREGELKPNVARWRF